MNFPKPRQNSAQWEYLKYTGGYHPAYPERWSEPVQQPAPGSVYVHLPKEKPSTQLGRLIEWGEPHWVTRYCLPYVGVSAFIAWLINTIV